MKTLNEVFTDQEFAELQAVKQACRLKWHDFILLLLTYTKRSIGNEILYEREKKVKA